MSVVQSSPLTVLIVEDHAEIGQLLSGVVLRHEARVVLRTNVVDASRFLEDSENSVDYVVSDGLHGGWVEVYKALRVRGDIPFLVLSTDKDIPNIARRMKIDPFNFILKDAGFVRQFEAWLFPPSAGIERK